MDYMKLLEFCTVFFLVLADIWFEDNKETTSANKFWPAKTIINCIAIVQFLEAVYIDIFKYLFIVGPAKGDLLGPVSIYFGIVEINNWGILHLNCWIWLQGVYYLVKLYNEL